MARILQFECSNSDFKSLIKLICRTAKETQLKSVPTLIKWGTNQRLQEGQLMDENMVKMMLED